MIPTSIDYIRILPEIMLSIFGIIVMMADPLMDDAQRAASRSA